MRVQEQRQHEDKFRYLGQQAHGIIYNADWIANNVQADVRRAKNRTAAGTPTGPTPKDMVSSSVFFYSAKQHNQGVQLIDTNSSSIHPQAMTIEIDTRY
jgi:hypothetical protein